MAMLYYYGHPRDARSTMNRVSNYLPALYGAMEPGDWKVSEPRQNSHGRPDILLVRDRQSYAAVVKAAPEGRGDRLIPLWSQAWLQAVRAAGPGQAPLAVVAAPRISPKIAEQVIRFAAEHVPEAAAGVIDAAGLRRFIGPGLEGLDADPPAEVAAPTPMRRGAAGLFSDLNQWMLKLLLAPDIPEEYLGGPRATIRNATHLAAAANVTVMTASRLVNRLREDGYLGESRDRLVLVRRADLLRLWEAAASQRIRELPMRFLLRAGADAGLRRLVSGEGACLGLFAAAEALGFGHVSGVPPHVYVRRLDDVELSSRFGLVPAGAQAPDLMLRQPAAPHAVFGGMVHRSGLAVSDVLQVWLDVASHPSRGPEQAEVIRRRMLDRVIQGTPDG